MSIPLIRSISDKQFKKHEEEGCCSPTIFQESLRVSLENESALRARCADVEGIAKVIDYWMSSTYMDTGDPLDGPRMIARAVSAWLLGK